MWQKKHWATEKKHWAGRAVTRANSYRLIGQVASISARRLRKPFQPAQQAGARDAMNVSSDHSQFEAPATVLKFPGTAPSAKTSALGTPKTWLLGTLAVLVVAAGGAMTWWVLGTSNPVQYATTPVSRGAVTRAVTATGTVNPVLTIIVGSYVSGVIQSLSCDYNTEVKAGQVCAKIDPRPFQATLDQYSGQLLRDQAILDKDRVDLARYQQLAAQNSIARQQAEDQAFIVHQDEGTVALDQGLVEGAKLNLGYTDIISPVDGTVVSRNVTQGQTVAASFQTPTLFLIATDLKTMQVDTNVSESDIGGIKEGNQASFTVDAFAKRVFQGAVSQVRQSPQTVQNVVTYDVVVSVDNADLSLKPGMTAAARIVTDQRDNVVRVPNQALRYTPRLSSVKPVRPATPPAANQGQVWMLRDGAPVAVPVVVGLDDDSYTEIISGDIKPGDLVITGEQSAAAGQAPGPRLQL
jgi:HlyD family secretion protein